MRKYMSKGNRIILGIVILMFVGAIVGCGGIGIRAEALTTMSPTYRPQGNYTWVSEGAYGASSQGSGSGYALKQASTTVAYIYIMNEGAGDMQDLEYGTLLSMAEYNIVLFEMGGFEVTSTRFVLKRNGVSIVDLGDLGTGGMPLFSGALQDGEYNFITNVHIDPINIPLSTLYMSLDFR